MTPEEQKALFTIQQSFPPEVLELADEFAEMLKGAPADDLEREANNIGNILMTILKHAVPQMKESMRYSLPFAFSRLLLQRLQKAN
jgi:hypothetical protein